MDKEKVLFLFDIDGTLIELDKTGRWVYQRAINEVIGENISLENVSWAGTTDIEIIHEIVVSKGFNGRESVRKMREIFEKIKKYFRILIESEVYKIKSLPYAYETLEWCYNNHYTSLLTGNIKEVAYMKISPFKMDRFLPVGAFGDEKKERDMLVNIALERAEKFYKTRFDRLVIVGDSHRDIIAAKRTGINCIITTTGKMTKEELLPYKPDVIIESLKYLPEALEYIQKVKSTSGIETI